MPDFPVPATGAERQDARRHGRSPTRGKRRQSGIRAFHLCISVLPAAVVGLFGLAAVTVLYTGDPAGAKTRLVLIGAAVGAAITLGAAVFAADSATRRVHRQRVSPVTAAPAVPHGNGDLQRRLNEVGFLVSRGRQDIQELLERLANGEKVSPRGAEHPPADTGDPVMRLVAEVRQAQNEAWNAVLAAGRRPAGRADHRVDVFVNLARRMQSLSHRAIQGLDELENQVEDPDLLKGLFRVDHLSTRMRRQAESLAVIGGAASRRQWSRPVTVYEVLRSAIAEVEHYNRVKVVPPVDGTLHGSAVADVIHLLAELIENATKFAPPHTQVLIRVETVTVGLAIEVEDRGLGIPRESQRRLNELLADLDRVDTDELLKDGRIGLLVVSALARRHNVRVQLQTNLFGGTQAVVVIPSELVGADGEEPEPRRQARPTASEPAPAMTASASMAGRQPSAAHVPFGAGADAGPGQAQNDREAAGARTAAAPPPSWDDASPALPTRHADSHAGAPVQGTAWQTAAASVSGTASGSATGSSSAAAPGSVTASGSASAAGVEAEHAGRAAGSGERPPLPRRRAQANLAPELVNAPAFQQDDQGVEHNPGLMAAFQRGMRSGHDDDAAADGADGTG